MIKILLQSRQFYILILILAVVGLGLYWFELKPSSIRNEA